MNDILFGNTNRPVIKKLAGRYFKSSKSRNVIAVIAIILTAFYSQPFSRWVLVCWTPFKIKIFVRRAVMVMPLSPTS